MSATQDRNRLQAALAKADLRGLLMVMFQVSGEEGRLPALRRIGKS